MASLTSVLWHFFLTIVVHFSMAKKPQMKLGKLLLVDLLSSFEVVYISHEPSESFSYWKVKKEFF